MAYVVERDYGALFYEASSENLPYLEIVQGVEGADNITVVEDISVLIPGSIDFKIDTIVFDPDMIQINGDTDNFNTVDSIKNGLQKSSYFGSVEIGSAKLDSSGTRVAFKVILSRRGKKI